MKESQIKKPYILYVGNDYPHKNLKRLKLAFKKLNLDYKLVLVTEFISDPKLDELYKNASLYIQPSLIEGFGLPPLEAMACGAPVIAPNASSLPEVLGDAAECLIPPVTVESVYQTLEKVLNDSELRKKLARAGLEQAKKFSWQKTAQQTVEVYRQML